MYVDPKRVRSHVVKVCLDDYEKEIVDRIVARTGQQRQVVLRELLLKALAQIPSSEVELSEV